MGSAVKKHDIEPIDLEELEKAAYLKAVEEKVLAGIKQSEQGLSYTREEVAAHLAARYAFKIDF